MVSVCWPLLCAGPSPSNLCAGPSPRHLCAGIGPCSGPALTTRGRHTQRLVYPTWARDRVGDQPLLRWAHDLRLLGPYFSLGRVLATFAPGLDPAAGRPLLSGAATLNGSSIPLGHETVSETGHFCAGYMVSVCPALTLRWAETGPLLRWARVPLLCPYFALGLDFPVLMHLPGSRSLALSSRALLGAHSPCTRGSTRPRSPSLAPFSWERVLPASGHEPVRTLWVTPFPGSCALRAPRSSGLAPGGLRHSGAGSVQCFNAAGAQPPPGDGPGPGRRRLSPSVMGGGWLVGCPVG